MSRTDCVERLAAWLAGIERPHPVRVAIDGPDAAGKTTLVSELAAALRSRHRRDPVALSIEDFERPVEERYRRGDLSPDGYYDDAFDYQALRDAVLEQDALVLVDGLFLQRAELADCWDARVWIEVSDGEIMRRALDRDVEVFGSRAVVHERYTKRYLPAQRIYATRCRPAARVDVILHNENPERPSLTWV